MAAAAEGPAEQRAGPKAPAVSPGGGSVLPACGRGEGGEGGGEEGERAEFSSYTEFLLTSLGYSTSDKIYFQSQITADKIALEN